jgi:hypothetical protein
MWNHRFATVVMVGLGLGIVPATAQDATNQIDISKAGTTPAEHLAFVKAMPPPQQAGIIQACMPVLVQPAPDTPPAVAAFCKTIGESGVPAAGTTAEQNAAFVKGLPAEQQANIKALCVPVAAKPADASGSPVLMAFCKNVGTTP